MWKRPILQWVILAKVVVSLAGCGDGGGNDDSASAIDLREVRAGIGGLVVQGDGQVFNVVQAGDTNGDGMEDIIVRTDAALSYLVFGRADTSPIVLSTTTRGAKFVMLPSGTTAAGAGDVNGDGLADLLIGDQMIDSMNGQYAGIAYVVLGSETPSDVTVEDLAAGVGGYTIYGRQLYERLGAAVSTAGDINSDDLDDMMVCAAGTGGDFDDARGVVVPPDVDGACYVLYGKQDTNPVDFASFNQNEIQGYAVVFRGRPLYHPLGASATGDFNGDSLNDIAFGMESTYFADFAVVFGKTDTDTIDVRTPLGDAGFLVDNVGRAADVFFADINGDGLADGYTRSVAFDSPSFILGRPDIPTSLSIDDIQSGTGGYTIEPLPDQFSFGGRIGVAGDVNADGFDDVLVGYLADAGLNTIPPNSPGYVYVVFGREGNGPIMLADIREGQGGALITGSGATTLLGSTVAGVGDFNGDGVDDFAMAGETYELFIIFGDPELFTTRSMP